MAIEKLRDRNERSTVTPNASKLRIAKLGAFIAATVAACTGEIVPTGSQEADEEVLLDGTYQYAPPLEGPAPELVTLQGVFPEEIERVVAFVKDNYPAASLWLDVKSANPTDTEMNAVRRCNEEVKVTFGSTVIRCDFRDLLPGGPSLPKGTIGATDIVTIGTDFGWYGGSPNGVTGAGIGKTRQSFSTVDEIRNQQFFGDANYSRQTGEYPRRWLVQIKGRRERNQ